MSDREGGAEAVTDADYRILAETLPQLAWIAEADGTIIWYNQRWYDYTSTSLEEMRGWGWSKVHHPDHVAAVTERYQAAIALGTSWEDTFPLRGQDGVYRWFLSKARPHCDASGRVLRWYGTNTDISGRRAIEERLRHSEQRFRALVDASAAVIWNTNAAGELTPPQVRWSIYTGQTEEAYQGWGWLDAVHPDDRGHAADEWAACVEARSTYEVEYRLRRHDGAWRAMEVRGVPVLAEDGSLREWVGTCVDVTERKEAEEAVERARQAAEAANLAKSQFIANMSHELRTPLSAVIGYSEMLGEELEDIGQAALLPDLRKIEAAARHLLSLINDVLDISKIEAGRMTASAETFAVADLLQDVADSTGSLVEKKGNRFVLVAGAGAGAELGSMHQDQTKIRQCLLNLIGNAAKFTEQGTVTLTVRRHLEDGADWLSFAIADTGIGMSEEQIGRLFERFVQADESTTRQFGGTGLGLSITRAFCRTMGGDIAVTSNPGAGSTFTIRLPATLAPEDAPLAEAEAHAVEPHEQHETVLLVDDDPAARELLQRFLEREGFHVRSANDGRAGLTLARALKPRAILLDVEMPRMDGWAVLHAVRNDPDLAGTPVIMTSVVAEQGLGQALGATDYFVKPINWDRLKGLMERYRPAAPDEARILVVDDDADARERLRRSLGREGWTVDEAENGRIALERVSQARPSMILLDLMMPEMDGFGFLRALRARPDGDVPVVVLTAKEITHAEKESLTRQADRVIAKGSMSLAEIGRQLRVLYARSANEPVPGQLQGLIARLAEQETGDRP
ncbi:MULTISPECIES: response regulator [unclassified Methylobacterium]|uniref:hybrid sensor histidine kinase/response regulator n=1 Tax=unclassified Methylobacterium TaxID=2615210 RepID=UPI00226A7515|nr:MULTISPECIES: response regulator [unclassified Methylobacterium]